MTSIKKMTALVALGTVLALTAVHTDAEACGGCFVAQSETGTQVTGHRMVLSLGQQQTTLYDQIEYAGEPSEFGWVLPIKGIADIGLSSDILFETLNDISGVNIQSPRISCPPQNCPDSFGSSTSTGASGGGGNSAGEEPPVNVLAQETVGPFETVQLESTDPNALADWLTSHGYNVPAEIQPIIASYVSEGFNFLAMKLVPGQGVQAMRPVRITTMGASPVLPLRMVAAGTGATTTMTLWLISEGRYQPTNFPWFVINSDDLVWDWDTQSSNYSELVQRGYDDTSGFGWLVESAQPMNEYDISSQISYAAEYNSANSGYGDGDPQQAVDEAAEDMATLFAGLNSGSLWYTRLRAEASRAALVTDLSLEAADSQAPVERFHDVIATTGTEPSCPPPPVCDDSGSGWFGFPNGGFGSGDHSDSSCAASGPSGVDGYWAAAPLLLFGLVLASRRRRRRPTLGKSPSPR